MKTANEVVAEMKRRAASPQIERDWKQHISKTSKWYQGSKADPECKICEGMGYVRFDLPVGHYDFGKIFECECVMPFQAKSNSNRRTPEQWGL